MKYSPGELIANCANWFFASSRPPTVFTQSGCPSGSFLKMSNFPSMTVPNSGFNVAATGKGNLASSPSTQLMVFQINQLCDVTGADDLLPGRRSSVVFGTLCTFCSVFEYWNSRKSNGSGGAKREFLFTRRARKYPVGFLLNARIRLLFVL